MLWISANPEVCGLSNLLTGTICFKGLSKTPKETQSRQQLYTKTHTNNSIQQPHEAPKCEYTVEFEINDMQVSDVAGQPQTPKAGTVPEWILPGQASYL